MVNMPHSQNHQGSHALPVDARKLSTTSAPSTEKARQHDNEKPSSLHGLAARARDRRTTSGSQSSRPLYEDVDAHVFSSSRPESIASSLSRVRRNSAGTRITDDNARASQASSLVESLLGSAVFERKWSTSSGRPYDFTPELSPVSNASQELYREEVCDNDKLSNEIVELQDRVDDAIMTAHLNEKLGNAMIAYYTSNGASMLAELTAVTQVAETYTFDHLAARAQLWKAMILHEMGEVDNMAVILRDILPIIVGNEDCTDADRYHMRRLVLLHGTELWTLIESMRRDGSPNDHEPVDPTSPNTEQSMLIWGQRMIQLLEDLIGDKIGLWPNSQESLSAIEDLPRQKRSTHQSLLPDLEERYRKLAQYNEQLQADIARYRAERQVYSNLSTPNYPPAYGYGDGTPVRSHQSMGSRSRSTQSSRVSGDESWLGARSPAKNTYSQSEDPAGVRTDPAVGSIHSSPRKPSRKRYATSSPKDQDPLKVRNHTPSGSSNSSLVGSFNRVRRKSTRSSAAVDWRSGSPRKSTRARDTATSHMFLADSIAPERRGSNLRNMALAESFNENQEDEVSPKDVSHRKPSYVRQRPSIDTGLPHDIRNKLQYPPAGSFNSVSEHQIRRANQGYEFPPDFGRSEQIRRRSSTSDREPTLQIDSEERVMTGALSPTELEQRLPKYLEHKEQERKKSVKSSDFPQWDELRARLLSPQKRERPRPEILAGPSTTAATDLASNPEPSKQVIADLFTSRTKSIVPHWKRPANIDDGFDFDHVQQKPQQDDERSSRISPNRRLPTKPQRRAALIAPLTPDTKSPPSSAISVPREFFKGQTMYTSPKQSEFDGTIARDDTVQPSVPAAVADLADIQPLESGVISHDPPRRKIKLPEIRHDFIPDIHRDRQRSSEESNKSSTSSTQRSTGNRISTFLHQLNLEALPAPQRRDSKPTISSPLRSSFGLDEGSADLRSPSTEIST